MNTKKLYRSDTDVAIAGVCGGIAEYLEVDSVIIRLGAVILALVGGSGIIFYLLSILIIPKKPAEFCGGENSSDSHTPGSGAYYYGADGTRYENMASDSDSVSQASSPGDSEISAFGEVASDTGLTGDSYSAQDADPQHYSQKAPAVRRTSSKKKFIGGGAIALGIFILIEKYLSIDSTLMFAICLIGFGLFLLIKQD